MTTFEREEIVRFLINSTPMMLDLEKEDLKYDSFSMYYKIYKYIKELEEEIKKLRGD